MDFIRPYLEDASKLFLLWLAVALFFGGFGMALAGPAGFKKAFTMVFLGPLMAAAGKLKAITTAVLGGLLKKSWKQIKRSAHWLYRKIRQGAVWFARKLWRGLKWFFGRL